MQRIDHFSGMVVPIIANHQPHMALHPESKQYLPIWTQCQQYLNHNPLRLNNQPCQVTLAMFTIEDKILWSRLHLPLPPLQED